MPDTPVDRRGDAPYPSDMNARVAVLEEIASATKATLDRIERRIDAAVDQIDQRLVGMTADLRALRSEQRHEFRTFLGMILAIAAAGFGLIAHGFHWLP